MDESNLAILKTLYSQQQSTAHIVRERMSKITAGAVSVFVAIDGWLITGAKELSDSQVSMLVLSVVVIAAVAVYAVRARYLEFAAVGGMIVRIETAMGIYEPGKFIDGEPLYALEHQDLGKDEYAHSRNIFIAHAATIVVFGLLSISLGILA